MRRPLLTPKRIVVALLSTLSAALMCWFTFFMLSLPYVYGDELLLIRLTSVTKNIILNWQEKPDSSRFLFVDVAWDKELIDKNEDLITPADTLVLAANDTTIIAADTLLTDEGGLLITPADTQVRYKGDTLITPADTFAVRIGNEAITSRSKLMKFLRILNRKPDLYKFVVCDVSFMGASPYDEQLLAEIVKAKNLVISYHRDEKDKPEYPDLPIPKEKLGLSDIEKVSDVVVKFNIYHNDSLKATPLIMYEQISGKKFARGPWFYQIGGQNILTSFILDYRLRAYEYTFTPRYNKVFLGELLAAVPSNDDDELATLMNDDPELAAFLAGATDADSANTADEDEKYAFIEALIKDRIIFIGDFQLENDNDVHQTIYGTTQGPLILVNSFLALEAGDNIVQPTFLIYLYVCFWVISYWALITPGIYGMWLQRILSLGKKKEVSNIVSITAYIILFAGVSVVSYVFFDKHIGTLILSLYMNAIDRAKKWWAKRYA
ncbi:hypothetical protein [Eisenibacter elegans]|uniref:hypothetical protein n=1 Tax=Eisenibacter elegans TaxID=997 RepID=UPI0012B61221|nr:hypothetical protein [Eisenibacter elegans]